MGKKKTSLDLRKTSTKLLLAWAAGFYDGEGSTKNVYYHYKNKKGKRKKPNANICMTVSQTNKQILLKFKKSVGGRGRINGPYQYSAQKKPYWIWSANCLSARETFNLLKPYLSFEKRKQYEIVAKETRTYSRRKKGWISNRVKGNNNE